MLDVESGMQCSEAVDRCARNNANLASIHSQNENDFIAGNRQFLQISTNLTSRILQFAH